MQLRTLHTIVTVADVVTIVAVGAEVDLLGIENVTGKMSVGNIEAVLANFGIENVVAVTFGRVDGQHIDTGATFAQRIKEAKDIFFTHLRSNFRQFLPISLEIAVIFVENVKIFLKQTNATETVRAAEKIFTQLTIAAGETIDQITAIFNAAGIRTFITIFRLFAIVQIERVAAMVGSVAVGAIRQITRIKRKVTVNAVNQKVAVGAGAVAKIVGGGAGALDGQFFKSGQKLHEIFLFAAIVPKNSETSILLRAGMN